MTLTDTHISNFRRGTLCAVGLCCAAYALMAIAQNRPDPVLWYLPGIMGLLAAFAIFGVFFIAGPQAIRMASDELFTSVNHRAQRHAYWIAVAMYPLFGLTATYLGLRWDTVFAAMGTFNGASYLLLLTFNDWRMS